MYLPNTYSYPGRPNSIELHSTYSIALAQYLFVQSHQICMQGQMHGQMMVSKYVHRQVLRNALTIDVEIICQRWRSNMVFR